MEKQNLGLAFALNGETRVGQRHCERVPTASEDERLLPAPHCDANAFSFELGPINSRDPHFLGHDPLPTTYLSLEVECDQGLTAHGELNLTAVNIERSPC